MNVPVGCQFAPPLIEYSTAVAPVATIVIEPSVTPQPDGSTGVTLAIVGGVLSFIITSTSFTTQVPSPFLTLIS